VVASGLVAAVALLAAGCWTSYGANAENSRDAVVERTITPAGGDLGVGMSVTGGRLFVPYGFWFFAAPPNPNGGIVAYGLG
jgi:hypothetical protein